MLRARRIALRKKPIQFTIAVTGATVALAAVASGVVALRPAPAAGQQAAATAAGKAASSAWLARIDGERQAQPHRIRLGQGGLQLISSQTLEAQAQVLKADVAERQQRQLARDARAAAVARARRTSARQAAQRAAARQAAARRAAQQAARRRAAARRAAARRAATPSGSPRQIAMSLLGSYGWSSSQFSCLNSLWTSESGWSVTASNPSGAYGIPQALPGSKMASAGPDWQTDATTQIKWGLDYIKSLYGSPCGAWAHEESTGWY